jgi:hypothetical protein
MSNFSYKDARGNLTQTPVRYGDMSRQVANIIQQNSENIMNSVPFISCYIKDVQFDRDRMQDPSFISAIPIRERAEGPNGEYLNIQGANYTVERIMPSPYMVTFNADIWCSNTDQKLQLWEQMVVLFNPALELQTTDNFIDWTSISYLELTNMQFETRSIPQGLESDISICSMSFKCPIWISPPAKVKKLGIITKIINNIFEVPTGSVADGTYNDYLLTDLFSGQTVNDKIVVTPGNYDLLILNNSASLLLRKHSGATDEQVLGTGDGDKATWRSLLDLYPGQFQAGLSQIRLTKPDGSEIVAYASVNPTNDFSLILNFDPDTVPANTILAGRGTVDAIVNPLTYNPQNTPIGTRYLILEDINITPSFGSPEYSGPVAWKDTHGHDHQYYANDIIQWDGSQWQIILDSTVVTDTTYITNSYTGIQYKWDGTQWSKSYEGLYDKELWRLVL